jgi:hypothetical protein
MANVVDALMIELCGREWKGKLIWIATDGARKMTGRHSSAVARLASGAFPGFYRIRCGAHQLDLIIQDVTFGPCGDTFYRTLTSYISHLGRQENLVSSMKTTCPKVASTRWLSLGRVCTLFGKYRDIIVDHFEGRAPASTPPPLWWILLLSVLAFNLVAFCLKNMQVLTTLMPEQYVMLRNLVTNLKFLLVAEGLCPQRT